MKLPAALALAAAAGLASHALAFYAGRRTAPSRIEERERVVYRDRVVTVQAQQQTQQHEEAHAVDTSTRTRIVYREGPVQFIERETTRADSTARRDAASATTVAATEHATERVEERIRIVAAPAPRWALGASVGMRVPDLSARPERVNIELSRRLFAGFWVTAGASASPSLSSPIVTIGLRKEF